MLPGSALRATMTTQPILLAAPVPRMRARLVNRREDFAGEAVISYARNGAFDAGLVPSMPHARGVDMKMASLGILEKRGRDARRERIRIDDDGLGVIRNEDRK